MSATVTANTITFAFTDGETYQVDPIAQLRNLISMCMEYGKSREESLVGVREILVHEAAMPEKQDVANSTYLRIQLAWLDAIEAGVAN